MAHFSALLGRPVCDAAGQPVGKLVDLIVPADTDYPAIQALVAEPRHGERVLLPWSDVATVDDGRVHLARPREEVDAYTPADHDVFLARQVLDRQIIDINGRRVVRVNDLELLPADGTLRLMGVDVDPTSLLRRLGVERPMEALARALHVELPHQTIDWCDIDPVESGPSGVRLRVPAEDLARMHPADIAEIINSLDQRHGEAVLAEVDAETAAEAMEEVDPELQVHLLEAMDAERAADILEEMDPDDAADLLGDMTPERASALLAAMEPDEAAEVRELLAYPEDTAGGIMTNEYATVPPAMTAQEAIAYLRREAEALDEVYYVYVVDADEHLLGVFTLRDLIVAAPDAPVSGFAQPAEVRVQLYDPQEHVARVIAKYNLLAVPVVDDDNRLHGIVTVDDAVDIILPVAWKKRLPRIFH
ncbi:MAG TPA: CBS domain-containing protein [Chloroflexota bacterium]|jgi:CBS domain-containing protein/sporulation protein YlmC with PRC-barrel domain